MSDTDSPNDGKPRDFATKAEAMADEALEAGRNFVATDTGKKVAELSDTAFAKAEDLRRKAMESDLGKKALDSDLGKQAIGFAQQAADKTRQAIPNELGRNIAVGAAAGAVIAIPLPFIGSLLGAIVGGGLGYLRTITKNR